VNLKAIKRLVEADALKMEIIPNPKVRVKVRKPFLHLSHFMNLITGMNFNRKI
jgi:hypothetical protein